MIDALIQAYRLKDETRTGWQLRGIRDPESVADHSWGTAYLALVYADNAGVDRARAVEIAIVHDLAEALTGDVATRVTDMNNRLLLDEKRRNEYEAVVRLTARYEPQQADRVRSLWDEYEASESPEALFVRDMNLIDMCIQAFVYEREGRYDRTVPNESFPDFQALDEFFATTRPRITTSFGERLFLDVSRRYETLRNRVYGQ